MAGGEIISGITIDAAFLSSNENKVYLFKKNKCILFEYMDSSEVTGPLLTCEMFPSFIQTPPFGERGIDCAFNIQDRNEAFIFSGIQCARLNFETGEIIMGGPSAIASMFPFLKGKVFETGVDAAFKSPTDNQAYLFRGSQYALINYSDSDRRLIESRPINRRFRSLANDNIFQDGIDAAFPSQSRGKAYIFNGIYCALFDFESDSLTDKRKISEKWPRLIGIRALKHYGLDVDVPL